MEERLLIVNADDLGLSDGVNRGVVKGHEEGVVTSASLLVRWPAAEDAAGYARHNPSLDLGLHLDLGEWACREGRWVARYEVVPPDDPQAVTREAHRQLETFRRLLGRDPTHLDSHQHVHTRDPARSVLQGMASRLGVPLRHSTPWIRYCGSFYGQTTAGDPLPEAIRLESLLSIVRELPVGVTELACHPGLSAPPETDYREERQRELTVLCAPQVRRALEESGVRLASFALVSALGPRPLP